MFEEQKKDSPNPPLEYQHVFILLSYFSSLLTNSLLGKRQQCSFSLPKAFLQRGKFMLLLSCCGAKWGSVEADSCWYELRLVSSAACRRSATADVGTIDRVSHKGVGTYITLIHILQSSVLLFLLSLEFIVYLYRLFFMFQSVFLFNIIYYSLKAFFSFLCVTMF